MLPRLARIPNVMVKDGARLITLKLLSTSTRAGAAAGAVKLESMPRSKYSQKPEIFLCSETFITMHIWKNARNTLSFCFNWVNTE